MAEWDTCLFNFFVWTAAGSHHSHAISRLAVTSIQTIKQRLSSLLTEGWKSMR